MPRLLFEKTGNAVWMSHLDLMRLFQRAFKRAGLNLKHTQGFNPRPSVSIALPLSVAVQSQCELLDFELDNQSVKTSEICRLLNEKLVDGVRVIRVYENGRKIKHLAYLDCAVWLTRDAALTDDALAAMDALFRRETLTVEKHGKNGVQELDIAPMIRKVSLTREDANTARLDARICCQNPTLNPALLVAAIGRYLPEFAPDFTVCRRMEIYDTEEKIFR